MQNTHIGHKKELLDAGVCIKQLWAFVKNSQPVAFENARFLQSQVENKIRERWKVTKETDQDAAFEEKIEMKQYTMKMLPSGWRPRGVEIVHQQEDFRVSIE